MSVENTEENTFDFDTYMQTVQGQRKLKEWLDSEDGKELLQPRLDSYFTKGLNTWKENNLDKVKKEAQEEVRKQLQPDETPEQKRVRELEDRLAERDNKDKRRELFDKARKAVADKNIPEDVVSKFIGQDETETNNNITTLIELFEADRRRVKEEALGTLSRDVPSVTSSTVNVADYQKQIQDLQTQGKVKESLALRRQLNESQQQ